MDPSHVAMKSGGFYDQNSDVQWSLALKALPLIQTALDQIELPDRDESFVLADYGCADGGNSVRFTDVIVAAVRRMRREQTIAVYYNDLFTNNFNQLFQNLAEVTRRREAQFQYRKGAHIGPVFEFATGGSFYEPVMPPMSTHFGFSIAAVHWLSQRPKVAMAEQICSEGASEEVRKVYAQQAEFDWLAFLGNRAGEFVPGGKLLLSMVARPDADSPIHAPFALINDVAKVLVEEGVIQRDDYVATAAPIYRRTEAEILAPLKKPFGAYCDCFHVEEANLVRNPSPFRAEYEETGDVETYLDRYVGFVRAISEAAIVRQLYRTRFEKEGVTAGRAACAEFYERMRAWYREHLNDYPDSSCLFSMLLTAR